MWGAFRWGALTKPVGRKEAWRVALVTIVVLPIVAPAAAVIIVTLPVFYLVELLVWLPLRFTHAVRTRWHQPAKRVNRPALRWKL